MRAVRKVSSDQGAGGSGRAALRIAAVAAALVALLAAGCSRRQETSATSQPVSAAAGDSAVEHATRHMDPKYRCPMHPDVVRDQPGQCPICGMTLVKFEPEAPAAPADEAGSAVQISPEVVQNLGVRTEPAVLGSLPQRADTVGYVGFDERRVRQVRPRAEGWVDSLSVRTMGETVRAGQVLFTLYSPMLESAQQEYLDAMKVGNRDLIDASRERLRTLGLDPGTAARLEKTGQASGRVAYTAPISGVVTEIEIREGSMVTPDMIAVTITELGSLWVIAQVPEAQSAWVVAGTAAEMSFPSLPGQRLAGHVEYVYPELDMETRTVKARITLDAPLAAIRPNMLASVSLVGTGGAEVVSIPRSALIRTGSEARVVIAKGGGRFAPRRVVAGTESGERVAITQGLEAGEIVVVAGQFLLDSEANLRTGLDRMGGEVVNEAGSAADHAGH